MEWESLSDCDFSWSLPTCTFLSIQKIIDYNKSRSAEIIINKNICIVVTANLQLTEMSRRFSSMDSRMDEPLTLASSFYHLFVQQKKYMYNVLKVQSYRVMWRI